jgi:hypothetical protein
MIDPVTPRDGETLAGYVFNAQWQLWVYPASYTTSKDCQRRAAHLSEAHGVPFGVISEPDGYYATLPVEHTAALRASMRPLASALAWDDSDTAAHVAETVDELVRGE